MKVVKKEGDQQIYYSYEDMQNEYNNLMTIFNSIEFSHNKVQLSSQQREEKDVFDLINQVLQIQRSLSKENEITGNDIITAIRIFSEISKIITDPKFIELVKNIKGENA